LRTFAQIRIGVVAPRERKAVDDGSPKHPDIDRIAAPVAMSARIASAAFVGPLSIAAAFERLMQRDRSA
jgi:hypothetical protein